jgi:hypothetical protein
MVRHEVDTGNETAKEDCYAIKRFSVTTLEIASANAANFFAEQEAKKCKMSRLQGKLNCPSKLPQTEHSETTWYKEIVSGHKQK